MMTEITIAIATVGTRPPKWISLRDKKNVSAVQAPIKTDDFLDGGHRCKLIVVAKARNPTSPASAASTDRLMRAPRGSGSDADR